MFLFVDTTLNIQLGLLNSNFEWVSYKNVETKKSSEKLHALIDDILKEQKLNLNEINGLIYSAGPGSYTGMRVSEGLVNIFDWQGFEYFSFYHFQVPKLVGKEKGVWYAKAFKGEYFIYSWNGDESESRLIKEANLNEVLSGHEIYSHQADEKTLGSIDLIKENPKDIFKNIVDNKNREELYYYRPLEQEFTRQK